MPSTHTVSYHMFHMFSSLRPRTSLKPKALQGTSSLPFSWRQKTAAFPVGISHAQRLILGCSDELGFSLP